MENQEGPTILQGRIGAAAASPQAAVLSTLLILVQVLSLSLLPTCFKKYGFFEIYFSYLTSYPFKVYNEWLLI